MRRPVMYLAGLFLATGASLALAGPASAVVSHDSPKSGISHGWHDNDTYDWEYNLHYQDTDSCNNGNTYNGFNVLNGVLQCGGLFG